MSKSINSWFVITSPLAPAYSQPKFNSSKVTEIVGGESAKVLKRSGDWLFVEQDDSYQSWINQFYGCLRDRPFSATHMIVEGGKIPFGTRIKQKKQNFITADGECRRLKQKVNSLNNVLSPDQIIPLAIGLLGSPYRWGGKTSFGFDCSGFVQIVCLAAGIMLPRDSWQQLEFLKDHIIDEDNARPGDLHFFGKNHKVTHVGFSMGGKGIIHCQGIVKEETFQKGYSNFNAKLEDMYISTHSIRLKFKT